MKKSHSAMQFLLSFQRHAETSSVLMLRAYVPATMKVQIIMEKDGPKGSIITNQKDHVFLPQFTYEKLCDHYSLTRKRAPICGLFQTALIKYKFLHRIMECSDFLKVQVSLMP